MGFFDAMSKMIKGEPIFDANQAPTSAEAPSGNTGVTDLTRHDTGQKVIPEVRVMRVKTSRNGDSMTSYAWVQNESPYAIVLKKMYVMGQGESMSYQLRPGQGREVRVYDGQIASHDGERNAHLDFHIEQNGDYFQQEFNVEFDRQADGKYLIEEFHPEAHVRDT